MKAPQLCTRNHLGDYLSESTFRVLKDGMTEELFSGLADFSFPEGKSMGPHYPAGIAPDGKVRLCYLLPPDEKGMRKQSSSIIGVMHPGSDDPETSGIIHAKVDWGGEPFSPGTSLYVSEKPGILCLYKDLKPGSSKIRIGFSKAPCYETYSEIYVNILTIGFIPPTID
jgi:hypothetical protein